MEVRPRGELRLTGPGAACPSMVKGKNKNGGVIVDTIDLF